MDGDGIAEVVLERIENGLSMEFNASDWHMPEARAYYERELDTIAVKVKSFSIKSLVHTNTVHVTVHYPNGVWQSIKRFWLPEWFRRKWPVKMTSHTVDVMVEHVDVYPPLLSIMPELEPFRNRGMCFRGGWSDDSAPPIDVRGGI